MGSNWRSGQLQTQLMRAWVKRKRVLINKLNASAAKDVRNVSLEVLDEFRMKQTMLAYFNLAFNLQKAIHHLHLFYSPI